MSFCFCFFSILESCLSYLKLKIRSVSTNQFSNFKVVCVSSLVGDGISYSRYTLPANATETDVHKRRCAVWSIQTFRTMLDLANRMAWSHVIIFTDNDTGKYCGLWWVCFKYMVICAFMCIIMSLCRCAWVFLISVLICRRTMKINICHIGNKMYIHQQATN